MKKIYSLAFLSGLMLLGSCASDAPEVNLPPIDDEGNIGYIRINFANSDATRADDPNSTENESRIENAAFIFRCADGSHFTTYLGPTDTEDAKWVKPAHPGQEGNQCAIIRLKKLPVTVAAIINGDRSTGYDLDDISNLKINKACKGNNTDNLFYMSSSKYYDANGNPVYRVPITSDQIFTEAETAASSTAKAVQVRVERCVAKVGIFNDITLNNGTLNPNKNGQVANAIVTFTPMYSFLTATSSEAYTVKRLPRDVTSLGDNVAEWINIPSEYRSKWVDRTTAPLHYPCLNEVDANWKDLSKASITFGKGKFIYPFDNNQEKDVDQTSIVVMGRYTVTNSAGQSLAAADGSFYLVGFENTFQVYKTEKEAIKAMGGTDTDVLVPEGVNNKDLNPHSTYNEYVENINDWKGWTGWMKIKGKNIVTRCIKYNGGFGYYSKQLNRKTFDDGVMLNGVVRNHYYKVNIKEIVGMGVGIPDPNQPIIPADTPDPTLQNYYLHMSVDILPWHQVQNNVSWGN
ncbi:MAG: fimbria major subunit [Muribaculaceae bacterium]|nr:fimbria major subunit [Muribaculaceae bacterium]